MPLPGPTVQGPVQVFPERVLQNVTVIDKTLRGARVSVDLRLHFLDGYNAGTKLNTTVSMQYVKTHGHIYTPSGLPIIPILPTGPIYSLIRTVLGLVGT